MKIFIKFLKKKHKKTSKFTPQNAHLFPCWNTLPFPLLTQNPQKGGIYPSPGGPQKSRFFRVFSHFYTNFMITWSLKWYNEIILFHWSQRLWKSVKKHENPETLKSAQKHEKRAPFPLEGAPFTVYTAGKTPYPEILRNRKISEIS